MQTPSPSKIDTKVIDTALASLIDEGAVAGVSALIYAGGEEVYYGDFGHADREADRLWERGTLVTIYSMTKPITGVTLLSLYEDGLFDFEDPLSKYLPEYADVKVFEGVNEDGSLNLVPPNRPIKVIDIFRHTACFGYGWGNSPISKLIQEAQLLDPSKPLSQFSQELAKIPLHCHPGTEWKYSVAVDVQARLAEVLTGQNYEGLVRERVLDPLGMSETSYFVPSPDKARLAAVYLRNAQGELHRAPDDQIYSFSPEKPLQINGGHGLISTIDDYMRFALMLQNEGTYDGVQILKPETIALMSRNHLPDTITKRDFLPSKGQVGFGLNVAVRIAPPANAAEPYGIVREFFWDGAASPFFWVDPKNDITAVFMIQVMPFDGASQAKFRSAVYEAMELKTD